MKGKVSLILAAVFLICGCSKEADMATPKEDADQAIQEFRAIVTVKQDESGTIYFQLDDNTVLFPYNYDRPFSGMERIICGLSVAKGANECFVQWMDFLVKGDVSYTQDAIDDGLDIIEDWMTSVEDGFLTIHYNAWWGNGEEPHLLLVRPSANEYELTIVHQMNGDEPLEKADALVYFDINEILPDTEGTYKDLTIKWKSCEGAHKAKTFRFRSRQP